MQERGAGDYLVVTPTFPLLEKKALPEFRKLFERWFRLGRYVSSPIRRFEVSPDGARRLWGHYSPDTPSTVWFGYAEDPESLESMTAKAAWLDEAGQKKFKAASWDAILRRLSLARGRILLTTTPYDLGWLKQKLFDPYQQAKATGAACDIDVVRFDSTENPNFPHEEFEERRARMPRWKFDLFYRGIFTRPAGLIYDSFIDDPAPQGHKVPRFTIPNEWSRYLGLDFGGVNTAGVFYAHDPNSRQIDPVTKQIAPLSGKFYLYRTYHAGGRTAKEHVAALLKNEPGVPVCVGGSRSEEQWRREFRLGGLPVQESPIIDVEVGIDRVYGAHKDGQILVFDDLADYLEQKTTYARELDENDEPTEKIADKASFHLMDAERYLWTVLRHGRRQGRAA